MPARNSIRSGVLAAVARVRRGARGRAGAAGQAARRWLTPSRLSLQKAPVVQLAGRGREGAAGEPAAGARGVRHGRRRPPRVHPRRGRPSRTRPYREPELIKRGTAEGLEPLAAPGGRRAGQPAEERARRPPALPGRRQLQRATWSRFPAAPFPVPLCRPMSSSLGTSGLSRTSKRARRIRCRSSTGMPLHVRPDEHLRLPVDARKRATACS